VPPRSSPRFALGSPDPESSIPPAIRTTLSEVCDEIGQLEGRIRTLETELEALGRQIDTITRLRTIPGIGLITATALVAFIGDVSRFPSGRHFASYLGLTPRERSSGSIRRLGRISKRGDCYLRMLLTHGARALLCHAKQSGPPDSLRRWAVTLEKKRGHNIATIALANRLARIVWATWLRGEDYREVNPKS
jgi:transposase